MKRKNNHFIDLINCQTPEEVRIKVREWSSSLSEQEHLIRSTILDIHANVELRLKQILYHQLLPLIFKTNKEQQNTRQTEKLEKTIRKMSFMSISNLLKPCLDSFPSSDFSNLEEINRIRNDVAHRDIEKARYKGRNPFRDHECLAQLFFESWAIDKELSKFFERMIDDPIALTEMYSEYYKKHNTRNI